MKQIAVKQRSDGSLYIVVPTAPDALLFDVTEQEYITLTHEIAFYKIQGGGLIFNTEKYGLTYPYLTVVEKIASLKAELQASDYKVIKCFEASMAGEPLPYDMVSVHSQREDIRAKIRQLEG